MKAIEQYFTTALFIMLYSMVLTYESLDEILKCHHSNEMKDIKQYSPVVMFIMLDNVVQTFESVNEILKCNIQNNESY